MNGLGREEARGKMDRKEETTPCSFIDSMHSRNGFIRFMADEFFSLLFWLIHSFKNTVRTEINFSYKTADDSNRYMNPHKSLDMSQKRPCQMIYLCKCAQGERIEKRKYR
jgi:hypothetical protein